MTTWNAADYHRNSTQQQAWAQELIDKLQLAGDERVLDLGCGDGKISAQIAASVPDGNVLGIDVSNEMIRFARDTFQNADHSNLTFEQADASALAFDREFDVVFSNAVLHWVIDHRPVLRGIARALRPQGRTLLQMGGKGNASDVIRAVNAVAAESDWYPCFSDMRFPYGFYAPDEYCPWLMQAGLDPVRVGLIPKTMLYQTVDGFAGWFRTTWMPFINRVPENRRDEFIDVLVARYLRDCPPDEQGRVLVRMVRLEVDARLRRYSEGFDPWP